jgi:hypothetical protein
MVSHERARALHGRQSFRVAGKIFATRWDAEHLNVMVDEDGVRTAVHAVRKRASRSSPPGTTR